MAVQLNQWLEEALNERYSAGLLRQRRPVQPIDATHVQIDGLRFINFASNNYLGLTHHPRLVEAVVQAAQQYGTGAGAAALISGYTDLHAQAEQALADWKRTEAAVLLPSGYQANHAAIQALASATESIGRPIRFLLDKLSHASLIDAVRGAGHEFRVFPHNGMEKLERLLRDANRGEMQVVATESIFSMDGDAADLQSLNRLKQRYGFVLLLDQAHASGVYGPAGSGYSNEIGLGELADVSVVTLSKSVGCAGGAVCGSRLFCQSVLNFGRAWIYSTSVPATTAAATLAALQIMKSEPQRQQRVRESARGLRQALAARGLSTPGLADCPIVPVLLGDERTALDTAEKLRKAGLWVIAVRPPTVPKGSSRLRITLSSEHTDGEIAQLVKQLTVAA